MVTISHEGYIKRNPVAAYRAQRRGGRGKIGATTREEDFVEHLFVASTHSYILFFTSIGRVYWLKVHEVPLIGRAARGKPLVNLSEPGAGGEDLRHRADREHSGRDATFASRRGAAWSRKTDLMAYSNPRPSGLDRHRTRGGRRGHRRPRDRRPTRDRFSRLAKDRRSVSRRPACAPWAATLTASKGSRSKTDDAVVAMATVDPAANLLAVSDARFGQAHRDGGVPHYPPGRQRASSRCA